MVKEALSAVTTVAAIRVASRIKRIRAGGLKEQPMPCQKMIITRPGKKRNEKRIYFSKCGVGGSKVRKN